MIIQVPDSKWRIYGESKQWQVQRPNKGKKGKDGGWEGVYFYSLLEHAVEKAYELALREAGRVREGEGIAAARREEGGSRSELRR